MPLGEELVDEEDAKGGEGEVIWARSPATAWTIFFAQRFYSKSTFC